MTDLSSWLEPRLTDAPESLRVRILDAVAARASSSSPLSDVFKETGERLMKDAQSASPTHETAMTLLAADALMTFAVEAAAESEPERLMEMR